MAVRPTKCAFVFSSDVKLTPDLSKKLELVLEEMIVRNKVWDFYFCKLTNLADACFLVADRLAKKYRHVYNNWVPCEGETNGVEDEKFFHVIDTSNILEKKSTFQRDLEIINKCDFVFTDGLLDEKLIEECNKKTDELVNLLNFI